MHKQPRNWFKDAGDYAGWYMLWGVVFACLQPVGAAQTSLWAAKLHQALFGAGFGFACALAFTILQNGFNRPRTKSISWIFAIGCWAVLSMLVALATGLIA
jgi:hypothetical protein